MIRKIIQFISIATIMLSIASVDSGNFIIPCITLLIGGAVLVFSQDFEGDYYEDN